MSEAGDVAVNGGCEQSLKHSNALDVAALVIPRHAIIVDTGNHGVGEAFRRSPGIIRCWITGSIFRASSFWVGVPCHDSTSLPLTVAETLPVLEVPAANDSRQSFALRFSPNIDFGPHTATIAQL